MSYGTGARALREAGEHVIDLYLPDSCATLDVIVAAGRSLGEYPATLVVSHEELAALCVGKIAGLPTMYMSHWLPAANDPYVQALAYADTIALIENERIRAEPPQAKDKVRYLGPVQRRFTYLPDDRVRVRNSLGLAPDEPLILVVPGTTWSAESNEHWLNLVVDAFDRLARPAKRMIWVSGSDHVAAARRLAEHRNIEVSVEVPDPDRFMVAADFAITKGTYCISRELAVLGVRSLSLSPARNWIDDMFIRSIPTNTCFWAADADPVALAECIDSGLDRGPAAPDLEALSGAGAERVARFILEQLASVRQQEPAAPAPDESALG